MFMSCIFGCCSAWRRWLEFGVDFVRSFDGASNELRLRLPVLAPPPWSTTKIPWSNGEFPLAIVQVSCSEQKLQDWIRNFK